MMEVGCQDRRRQHKTSWNTILFMNKRQYMIIYRICEKSNRSAFRLSRKIPRRALSLLPLSSAQSP
jgi:hypothetical protein